MTSYLILGHMSPFGRANQKKDPNQTVRPMIVQMDVRRPIRYIACGIGLIVAYRLCVNVLASYQYRTRIRSDCQAVYRKEDECFKLVMLTIPLSYAYCIYMHWNDAELKKMIEYYALGNAMLTAGYCYLRETCFIPGESAILEVLSVLCDFVVSTLSAVAFYDVSRIITWSNNVKPPAT